MSQFSRVQYRRRMEVTSAGGTTTCCSSSYTRAQAAAQRLLLQRTGTTTTKDLIADNNYSFFNWAQVAAQRLLLQRAGTTTTTTPRSLIGHRPRRNLSSFSYKRLGRQQHPLLRQPGAGRGAPAVLSSQQRKKPQSPSVWESFESTLNLPCPTLHTRWW